MTRIQFLVIVAAMSASCIGGQQPTKQTPTDEAKENQEPPQLFFLEFDGKKRSSVELDQPLRTDVLGGAQTVTLRVEPYRVFRYGGVRFHYPREYTFEADLSQAAVSIWTMSGPDCVILVQRHKSQTKPAALLESLTATMVAGYEGAKTKVIPTRLNFQGKNSAGKRIELRLADSLVHQDLFAFQSGNDSIVLMIQDSPMENGKPSADRIRAEKMLCETYQLSGN